MSSYPSCLLSHPKKISRRKWGCGGIFQEQKKTKKNQKKSPEGLLLSNSCFYKNDL